MHVQAVFFDLFETLITEFTGGERKVSRTNRNYEEMLGIPNDRFHKEWTARQQRRMNGTLPRYHDVLRDIAAGSGLRFDEETVERLYRERLHEKAIPFVEIGTEITDMLESLRKRGIKLGLISNCTEEEVRAWKECGLAAYFDDVLFSYEAGCAKPENRIYELACARLGVSAEHCLFVGDGGSNELAGAIQAGMRPLQATWFVPAFISDKITGFAKLDRPARLEKLLTTVSAELQTSLGTVRVSRAAEADLNSVLGLWLEAAEWVYKDKGVDQWRSNSFSPESVRKQYDETELFIATSDDGTVIGTFAIQWSDPFIWRELDTGDAAYVHKLIVPRAYAGRGLGKQLLDWAECYAAYSCKNRLRLDCMADNEALNRYYAALGFAYTGRFEHPRFSASLFEKKLQNL